MTKVMITGGNSFWFGPYADKETAKESKALIVEMGDSSDQRWKANQLKVVECNEVETADGFISYQPI